MPESNRLMADIVNLRQARKARARTQAEATASQNRISFGRSRKERQFIDAQGKLDLRRHESHRLEKMIEPGVSDET
jgi:hypothetical protein